MKKIWDWIISIPKDKLLHDYAAALIALFVFALLWRLRLSFWLAFGIADGAALLALIGKEVYDLIKKEGHTVELGDIAFGLFGIVKIDLALLLMLL